MDSKEVSAGGERRETEWDELTRMSEFQEPAPAVLETDAASAEVRDEVVLPRMLRSMRDHWGDLEKTEGVFGPKTAMYPDEYRVIAENMTWEEFAEFGDKAYDVGHESEDEYEKLLVMKGSELQRQGLTDWKSFVVAVRRYNVAKHLSQIGEDSNFYYSTSLEQISQVLNFGNLDGWLVNRGNEKQLQDQGLSIDLLHLSYDTRTAEGKLKSGIDGERGGGSKMVTVVFNKDVVWRDEFDLATKYPTLRNTKLNPHEEILVTQDRAVYNRLHRVDGSELASPKIDIPMVTRAEWLKEYGEEVKDDSEKKSSMTQLFDDVVLKVDKAEVKEFVDGFLEKIDPEVLGEILQEYKVDCKHAIEMAVDYFVELLGVRSLDVRYFNDKSELLGQHVTVGFVRVNERSMRRKPLQTLNMVAHEVFHEYQQQVRKKYEYGELVNDPKMARRAEMYAFCGDNYRTTFVSTWAYNNQILEREAFQFGNGVEKLLKKQRAKQRTQKLRSWLGQK